MNQKLAERLEELDATEPVTRPTPAEVAYFRADELDAAIDAAFDAAWQAIDSQTAADLSAASVAFAVAADAAQAYAIAQATAMRKEE